VGWGNATMGSGCATEVLGSLAATLRKVNFLRSAEAVSIGDAVAPGLNSTPSCGEKVISFDVRLVQTMTPACDTPTREMLACCGVLQEP